MPVVDSYRRAPLANPVFVPFSDGAMQLSGLHGEMTEQVLAMANIAAMTPLDAVLASKLGGYSDLPPVPNVVAAATELRENPRGFVLLARAALMTAAANQDKESLLRLITSMRVFLEALPELNEDQLLSMGADALRLTSELYRRTGMPFLLTVLEHLRAQLPDVSGVMHSFPFTKAYEPQDLSKMDAETARYHARMEKFATGSLMADALAMTAHLALYSGSGRDGAAGKAGLTALMRYHGAPTGAFTADPYLAGRDPARATDLSALCAQIEALYDLLAASGDMTFADRLELLTFSALPDLISREGIRALQPMNRLCGDDSCSFAKPEPQDTSALLRALYAIRRSVWMAKEEDEIAFLLPLDSGCLTRISGVPVRLTAKVAGTYEKIVTLSLEAKQPVNFTLQLRVPSFVSEAGVAVNGGREQAVRAGTLFGVQRTFRNGDTITLRLLSLPRTEVGYRGGVSVLCGPHLMALPLPDDGAGWQFALMKDTALTPTEENGELCVLATATDAPAWQSKAGFIAPPPQNTVAGTEYQLMLLPFARTVGRIAQFPSAVRKA